MSNTPAPTSIPASTSIGQRLRDARDARSLQLIDIAGTLRIKPQFLEALESGQPELLPTPTHASGFLRSYARYLGVELDTVPVPAPVTVVTTLAPPAIQTFRPTVFILPLAVLGILALLYGIWHWLQAPPPAPIAPPPANFGAQKLEPLEPVIEPKAERQAAISEETAPAATAVTPATVEATAPAAPAPVAPAQVAAPAGTITVRAVSDAWVQITDSSGRQLYSRLMRAGESWRAPAQSQGLRLSTGNAGGLVLVKNGAAGPPLGAQAQVLRNLPLTLSTTASVPAVTPKQEPSSADEPAAADTPDVEE